MWCGAVLVPGPGGLRRLYQLGQYPAYVGGVEEGDRRAHRAVPGALVEQAHPPGADRVERGGDIRHAVADVMNALAAAAEEPPYRCVWAERFEQLDPGGARCIASRTPWSSWISRLTTLSSNTVS